jgi:Fic family protein
MHGITAKGKPFKDYLDIRGHNNAIDYLLDLIRGNDYLTETDIRNLHQLLLGEPYEAPAQTSEGQPTRKRIIPGQYKTSPNHVLTATGQIHYYATPEETPAKMGDLMNWYREASINTELHPVVVSALFHHRFVSIHPFDDGNGRMTRLLMNLMLMRHHFPPTVIKQQDRGVYYLTLSQADAGDDEPFVQFVAENVKAGLELYLKGAKGESLDESDDLDKELALFKMEMKEEKPTPKVERTVQEQQQAYRKSIKPLLDQTRNFLGKIQEYFEGYKEDLTIVPPVQSIQNQSLKNITSESADSILDQLFSIHRPEQVFINIHLKSYKFRPTFDLRLTLIYELSDYKYTARITLHTVNLHLDWEKQYNEFLSQSELNNIIDKVGKAVISLLKKQAESPTK